MKKKILFVNDEMTMGGVARILNTLLLSLDQNEYEIDLLVLHKRGELLNEIPSGVNVIAGTPFFDVVDIPLKECKGKWFFKKVILLIYMKTGLIINKIKKERKKILNKEYDVEFSAKEGFCTIFTACGDSKRKLNWIQVDYKESNYSKHHMKLMKKALNSIDMNIACSNTACESYKTLFGVNRITVIHNLINESMIKDLSSKVPDIAIDNNKINLICVARFHKQKGVDRLIKAFAKLKGYYNLFLIGDGELKQELYDLAKKLSCFNDIKWLGIKSNPYADIKACDLLVMPSLYEGYPTLSLESLISGTPVLATNVAGIKEQIVKEEYGWIVDNNDDSIYNLLDEIKDSKHILVQKKKYLENYNYDNTSILSSIKKVIG